MAIPRLVAERHLDAQVQRHVATAGEAEAQLRYHADCTRWPAWLRNGACAANPVAVAIPCHRVVESAGGLGGYRWGVARKRALLAREAPTRQAPRNFVLPICRSSRVELPR